MEIDYLISPRLAGAVITTLLTATLATASLDTGSGAREINWPETRVAQGANLAELTQLGYERNPRIAASRAKYHAVAETRGVATGYPDPQLMVTWFPRPIETRLGPQDWNATLSQMIPFPGKLSKKGEIVDSETELARLALDMTVREVTVDISESYFELVYIRRAKSIAEKNIKLLDRLRIIAETSFGEDRSTLLDVTKAQAQTGQLRYDLIVLAELETAETARLNGLLNMDYDGPVGPLAPMTTLPLVNTLAEIQRFAEEGREELRMANVKRDRAELAEELATLSNYPDFKLGLFYAGIGEPDVPVPPKEAGRDAVGIQVGVSIPLWWERNSGRTAKARAKLEAAKAEKTLQLNDTRTLVSSLYFKLENSRRLVELYSSDLIPQAVRTLDRATVWHREGETGFAELAEAQATLYNFELALARARSDYGKAMVKLQTVAGRSLVETTESVEGK